MPFHHVTAGLLYKGNYLNRSLSAGSDSEQLANISVEELDDVFSSHPRSFFSSNWTMGEWKDLYFLQPADHLHSFRELLRAPGGLSVPSGPPLHECMAQHRRTNPSGQDKVHCFEDSKVHIVDREDTGLKEGSKRPSMSKLNTPPSTEEGTQYHLSPGLQHSPFNSSKKAPHYTHLPYSGDPEDTDKLPNGFNNSLKECK